MFFTKLVLLCLFISFSYALPISKRLADTDPGAPSRQPLVLRPQQPSLSFDMTDNLYSPQASFETLQTIPDNCAAYTSSIEECTTDMVATNITYDDCGDPWTVCRCDNANMTLDTVTERLGRVPVGLRRYVSTVVILPSNVTHAYTLTTGDIHFFGDCAQDTWLHEATHAYDYASQTPYSNQQAWLDSISQDSCAPDTYGTNNAVEEFAQMSVVKIYILTHEGMLPPGWDMVCMSHQLSFMNSLDLYDPGTLFANTCAADSLSDGARHTNGPPLLDGLRMNPSPPATALPSGTLQSSISSPTTIEKGDNSDSNAASTHTPRPWFYTALLTCVALATKL